MVVAREPEGDAQVRAAPDPMQAGEFTKVVRKPGYFQVAEQLRDAILDGRLEEGQQLPTERDLASDFGVSRNTIREALRTLQAEGFLIAGRSAPLRAVVHTVPNPLKDVYARLLRLGQITVLDLIPIRGRLEEEAIRQAMLDPRPGVWREAGGALERMRDSIGLVREFVAALLDFHLAVVRASGNNALDLTIGALHYALEDHLFEVFQKLVEEERGPEAFDLVYDEHVGILRALEAWHEEEALDLLFEQVDSFYRLFLTGAKPSIADRASRRR